MSKRMKHINELRAQAAAGDKRAMEALASEMFVPHHLRQGTALNALHKKIGTKFKDGVHITAKTLKAVKVRVATSISPDYGLDRLQMLKDRREARA